MNDINVISRNTNVLGTLKTLQEGIFLYFVSFISKNYNVMGKGAAASGA